MNKKVEYKDISIAFALEKVEEKKYLIPSLQRKYVWKEAQIYSLLDSIMQSYPFGTFLFWDIKEHEKDILNSNKFYEFLKVYDNSGNGSGKEYDIKKRRFKRLTCVIDGQQRLTSLYVAFWGEMQSRDRRGAVISKNMYIDINYEINKDSQEKYKFRFLSKDEVEKSYKDIIEKKVIDKDSNIWIKLGDVSNKDYMLTKEEFNSEAANFRTERSKRNKEKIFVGNQIDCIKNCLIGINADIAENILSDHNRIDNWQEVLILLFHKTHIDSPISYYSIFDKKLENIIEIFIRQNSAGTPLSKTQMLMSVLSSKWVEARDEVDRLLEDINKNGTFDFDIDFVMRAALYINDLNILVSRKNVIKYADTLKDRTKWNKVKGALVQSVYYLQELGFSKHTLSSNNAIIPIAFYLSKQKGFKIPPAQLSRANEQFKLYLFSVMALKVFGNHGDTVLGYIRDSLKHIVDKEFDFNLLNEWYKKATNSWNQKPLKIEDAGKLDPLLNAKFGREAFTVLGIISLSKTRTIDLKKPIHIDHIFPRKGQGYKTDSGKIEKSSDAWLGLNSISNLVFFQAADNILKSNKEPIEFLNKNRGTEIERIYKEDIFFGAKIDSSMLKYDNYELFLKRRKTLIEKELKKIFNV